MKVYVVKNDKNEYMTETGDFIKSLWQAELFYDYECAYCYAPTGCNIVECSLMEKYQLSDYTKQVRKEVVQEIKDKAYQDSEFYDLENGGISERKTYLINEHILNQIQGESNAKD